SCSNFRRRFFTSKSPSSTRRRSLIDTCRRCLLLHFRFGQYTLATMLQQCSRSNCEDSDKHKKRNGKPLPIAAELWAWTAWRSLLRRRWTRRLPGAQKVVSFVDLFQLLLRLLTQARIVQKSIGMPNLRKVSMYCFEFPA